MEGVKLRTAALTLTTAAALLLGACSIGKGLFDYISAPVGPPLASLGSGTYSTELTLRFEPSGSWKMGPSDTEETLRMFYTLDPNAPYAEALSASASRWIEIPPNDPAAGSLPIASSTTLRAFSYLSETEFSAVAQYSYELKCPTPAFYPAPGAFDSYPVDVKIKPPNLSVWVIRYSLDGSDPASSPTSLKMDRGTAGPMFRLDVGTPELRVRAVCQRPGWTSSDQADAGYSIDFRTIGMVLDVDLPDGTTISFNAQSSLVLDTSQNMTVNAAPANLARYEWALNGVAVPGASGSSITVGAAGPPAGGLPVGSYNLSCLGFDAHGYAYSNSLSFSVILP
jgi:hypothetical protein